MIEVLDAANQQLLVRQKHMYDGPTGFADKWAQARRFYQGDLASGFVRVQAELWAASMSNADLRREFLPRLRAWKAIVLGGVRDAFATMASSGIELPAPLSSEVVATWISEFWLGMEFADLIGGDVEARTHRDALDAMQQLLERLDSASTKPAETSKTAKPRGAAKRKRSRT